MCAGVGLSGGRGRLLTHVHRASACTLNAVGLLPVSGCGDARVAPPLPHHFVCVEKFTLPLPYLVSGRVLPNDALSLLRGMGPELTSAAKSGDAATDECVGLFTPDKDGHTHTSCGRVAVIAARRGTVCGEVGRVLRFCSTQHPHPLYPSERLLGAASPEETSAPPAGTHTKTD